MVKMFLLRNSLVIVFMSTLAFGRIAVHDLKTVFHGHDMISNAIERRPDSTTSVTKLDYNVAQKTTYSKDSKEPKCPDEIKPCLYLCCPIGEARKHGVCETDNATDKVLTPIKTMIDDGEMKNVSGQNFYLNTDVDPCAFDLMVPILLKDFYLLKTGLRVSRDFEGGPRDDFRHYCLFRYPESIDYVARACYPLVRNSNWDIFFATVVILIMLAVFTVYSVISEQKNLHGMIFRSYIATYFAFAVAALAVEFTTESRTNAYLYSLSDTALRYCAASIAFWLNAMSFNIWRSFRRLRTIDCNIRQEERRRFIGYAVYAWGSPAVLLTANILFNKCLPYLRNEVLGYTIKIWICVGVISLIYMCNAFLFISTVLAIRNQKKETAYLENGVNQNYEINKQWFILSIKLFVLSGGHIVMWVIWMLWPSSETAHVGGILEAIQAVLIFLIFVWKDNIKKSFCEQFPASVKVRFRYRGTITNDG